MCVEVFKFPGEFARKKHADDFGAVERRDRDEVEEGEPYVVKHDPVKELVSAHAEHAESLQEPHEKDGNEAEKKVTAGACQGYFEDAGAVVFVIARVDHDGLRPAKSAEDKQQRAHSIKVRQRVHRQTARGRRRGISERVGYDGVRVFMEGERQKKRWYAVDQRRQVKKIEHKCTPLENASFNGKSFLLYHE